MLKSDLVNGMKRAAKEPLLHFLIVALLLLAVTGYAQKHSSASRITIKQSEVLRIAERYRRQYGVPPSPHQLDQLVDASVRDEIIYREALKLGLDREDEIVRRRMIQKYEFLQLDLFAIPQPSAATLLDFYRRHLDQYRTPERVTFTHVYFSPDRRGEKGARDAAAQVAAALNAQGATRAAALGDPYPGPYDFSALTEEEAQRAFGRQGLAEALFSMVPGQWTVPLKSGFGWHTVYVSSHLAARAAPFEEVRDQVLENYSESQRDRRNDEALTALRRQFTVIRE